MKDGMSRVHVLQQLMSWSLYQVHFSFLDLRCLGVGNITHNPLRLQCTSLLQSFLYRGILERLGCLLDSVRGSRSDSPRSSGRLGLDSLVCLGLLLRRRILW